MREAHFTYITRMQARSASHSRIETTQTKIKTNNHEKNMLQDLKLQQQTIKSQKVTT